VIRVDPAKCSGCRSCEIACSFAHSGRVGRGLARIKVVKMEGEGLDVPIVCQQCAERPCLKCPEGALSLGPQGQVVVSPTLCTACGACEKLCPTGSIEICEDIPRVCDLCGGDPRCVKKCSMGAISYEPGGGGASQAAHRKEAKGLNPEGRRVAHAMRTTRELRSGWLAKRTKTEDGS
jgi:Fe-S-cluster-containing hydrogenase component 2